MNIQYAIVFVSDMQQAIEFYRDVIGITLRFESPEWTEFSTAGATLALHATSVAALEPQSADSPAGTTRIGFNTPDLTAFHQRMLENEVHSDEKPRSVFGARLAQYEGPDGLVFSVGESRGR